MSLILRYPTSGSLIYEVTLRSPNFGDSRQLDINTYNHRTRGGSLLYNKDINWVNIEKFKYQCDVNRNIIGETIIDDLIEFLEATAGLLISLTDHNSVERYGYIITPVIEIITRKDICSYDVAFEFLLDIDNAAYHYLCTEDEEALLTEDEEHLISENYE